MAKGAYIGVNNVARKIKKGYVGIENFTKRALPSGYTQVEYIESSGTQYVDTGIVPNQDTRIVMDVQLTSTETRHLYGARTSTSANLFFAACTGSTKIRVDYGTTKNTHNVDSVLNRLTLDASKNGGFVGNTSSTFTSATFSPDIPMALFASNTAGAIVEDTYKAKMKLFSCQIYDNGTLVRDYVPCTNASGTAGLYDIVNGVFYTNAGTGTFIVGTSTQSTARKIKKAYIGVGGVARPCWAGGTLQYLGTAPTLSYQTYYMAGAGNGVYAIFLGGYENSTYGDGINYGYAYNSNLTKTSLGTTHAPGSGVAAIEFDNRAWFVGACDWPDDEDSPTYYNNLTIYNQSLTKQSGTDMYRSDSAAATTDDYVIFAGGSTSSSSCIRNVYYFDKSATRNSATSLPSAMSASSSGIAGFSVGEYAAFMTYSTTGAAYDNSLTQTTFTTPHYSPKGISIGDYGLFVQNNVSSGLITAYDKSLTQVASLNMSVGRTGYALARLDNTALIAGGTSRSAVVDVVDSSLTLTTTTNLSEGRHWLAGASIGTDYAFFAGGVGTTYKAVDVYGMI